MCVGIDAAGAEGVDAQRGVCFLEGEEGGFRFAFYAAEEGGEAAGG